MDFKKNNFDLIRIVTALLVLVNHSLMHLKLSVPAWYSVVQQFQRVPMFFVMSGFLLSASFEKNSRLFPYFRNRFFRLYPGLWVCLILTIIIYSLFGVDFFNGESLTWFTAQISGLIYTPSFMRAFGYGSYNGSLWTIVVELQFYILLPVIYFLYKRFAKNGNPNNHLAFWIIFFLSATIALILKSYPHLLPNKLQKVQRYSFIPWVYIFMTGILLQRLKVWQLKIIRGKALWWAIGFLIFVYTMPQRPLVGIFSMIILAVCTISFAYTAPGIVTKYLKDRDLSYGVYMYHGMLLSILVEFSIVGNGYYLLFVAVTTLLLAWLSYKYVEAPAMKWARNKTGKISIKEPSHVPSVI